MPPTRRSVLLHALLFSTVGLYAGPATSAEPIASRPRILALPWMVIDRTTNKERSRMEATSGHVQTDAQQLAVSAQAALDGTLHRYRTAEVVARSEWEPLWKKLRGGHLLIQGAGCAVCSPAGQLLHYDRAALINLAQEVKADYVWLGVTVVPLTWGTPALKQDDCCREALDMERENVLARSSALLVRASDGEVVWQRDARWPDPRAKRRHLRMIYAPPSGSPAIPRSFTDREKAVDATARSLANALRRDRAQIFR